MRGVCSISRRMTGLQDYNIMINYLSEENLGHKTQPEDAFPPKVNMSLGLNRNQHPAPKMMSISAQVEPNAFPPGMAYPYMPNPQYPVQYPQRQLQRQVPYQYPPQYPPHYNQVPVQKANQPQKNKKQKDTVSVGSKQSESNKYGQSQTSHKRVQKNQHKHFSDLNQSSRVYLSQPSHTPILEHLNIMLFKTSKCPIKVFHQHKTCPNYHHDKDRRRQLLTPGGNPAQEEMSYTGDLCTDPKCLHLDEPWRGEEQERPKKGCKKSRNLIEQLYHPDKYKKKFCSYYPDQLQKCEYKQFCSFAHSESELRANLIHYYEMDADFFMFHYKTEWCPFNSSIHDKSKCVYAHNWQDYRRKVSEVRYTQNICQNWSNVDFITSYKEGCAQGRQCPNSHGWKESEYHPLNYKVRLCLQETNCPRVYSCPFYHDSSDQRILSPHVLSATFLYFPRNRLSQIMQCISDNKMVSDRTSKIPAFKPESRPPGLDPKGPKEIVLVKREAKPNSCNLSNMWNTDPPCSWTHRTTHLPNRQPQKNDPWLPGSKGDSRFDLEVLNESQSIEDQSGQGDSEEEEEEEQTSQQSQPRQPSGK